MSRYQNIDRFYEENREELLENTDLRPSKSTTRDVEATVNFFIKYYSETSKNIMSVDDILICLESSEFTDVTRTNIRTMVEFDFLEQVGDKYAFTDTFKSFIESGMSISYYILKKLYSIDGVHNINMYLNTILCTLREGYLYDSIVLYPDSFEMFKSQLDSKEKMINHCRKVYEIYGFKGRGRNPEDPNYTPNANYRVITELRKLNLIENSSDTIDGFKTCKLTGNAEHLLDVINNNLLRRTDVDDCHNAKNELLYDENLIGFNKIYYGIPGCGKSYKVSSILSYKDGFKEEANIHGINSPVESDYIFRTTFYLDYSNSDFVGQIYPVVEYKEDGSEFVTYKPLPGPFTKALLKAYTNPNKMVYLIIEEINRGNAAAIFGDLFQLLDRVKETQYGKVKGESEYPISNEFIEGYLKLVKNGSIQADGDISLLDKYINHNIIIPNNLTIFATMNTSDQNVFPLDTAFKRRWNLEKVTVDWSKNSSGEYNLNILNKCIPFTDMTWGCFINTINETMVEDEFISEDKNIGPYFIGEDILVNKEDRYNSENKYRLTKFMNNVIDYLYNDVTKLNHDILFEPGLKYSTLYKYFTEELHEDRNKQYKGLFNNILNDDIQNDDVNNIEENEDGDTE